MKNERGMTIIEFTLMSSFLMLILLAIASIGYFMFSMQAVSESVRAAARMASVCQMHDADINTYISDNAHISTMAAENIEIEYLDASGTVLVPDQDARFG